MTSPSKRPGTQETPGDTGATPSFPPDDGPAASGAGPAAPPRRPATVGVCDRPPTADRKARLFRIAVAVAIATAASAAAFAAFWYHGAG